MIICTSFSIPSASIFTLGLINCTRLDYATGTLNIMSVPNMPATFVQVNNFKFCQHFQKQVWGCKRAKRQEINRNRWETRQCRPGRFSPQTVVNMNGEYNKQKKVQYFLNSSTKQTYIHFKTCIVSNIVKEWKAFTILETLECLRLSKMSTSKTCINCLIEGRADMQEKTDNPKHTDQRR